MKFRRKTTFKNKLAGAVKAVRDIFAKPEKTPGYMMVTHQGTTYQLPSSTYNEWVEQAYKRNEVVHGAINLIISAVLESDLVVEDQEGNLLDRHPTHMLLSNINPYSTQKQFLRKLLLHLYLGNAAYVEKIFSRRNLVVELGLLRPDRVEIQADSKNWITGYRYQSPSGAVSKHYALQEVLWMPWLDPNSELEGFSPLKALAYRIELDNEMAEYQKSIFENSGAPGAVIKIPESLSRDDARMMAKEFDQRFGGDNRGKTCVLNGGADFQVFGMNFKDLEATELIKASEAKILSTLGVPLALYGSVSGQEATTYDNMRTSRKIFWQETVVPLQNMLLDFLNNDRDLINQNDFDRGVRICFDRAGVEALKEDQDLLSNRARLDYQAGIITLNEARIAGGYEALPEGDELRSTTPMFPMTQEEDPVEEEVVEEEPEAVEEDKKAVDTEKELEQAQEDQLTKNAVDLEDAKEKKYQRDLEIATKRMDIAKESESDFLLFANKQIISQLNDVLKVIKEQKSAKPTQTLDSLADLGNIDIETKEAAQNRILTEVAALTESWIVTSAAKSKKIYENLTVDAANHAAATVGASFNLESEAVKKAIASEHYKFAKKISETTANYVRDTIQTAFKEGKTLDETMQTLRGLRSDWTESRAKTIARTETARTANKGARIAYQDAKVPYLRYSAVLDDKTSDICDALDGKIVGVGDAFIGADESFTDKSGKLVDLSYTNGMVQEPPAHPNCRSTIIPEYGEQ